MAQLNFAESDEKKNKVLAFFLSVLVYGAFFLMLYFFKIIYEKPEEPAGVELNYGVDLVGTGDIQTMNKANASAIKEEMKPSEEKETKPNPVKTKAIIIPPPVFEKAEKVKSKETPERPILTTKDDESKVEAREKIKKAEVKPVKIPPIKTPPIVEEKKPVKIEPKPAPVSPPTPAKKVEPSVDNGSVMKKKGATSSSSNGTIGTATGIGGNNNGDGKKGEVGDKGDPRGTPDGKSLYGNPGKGGSGASIAGLQGWSKKKLNVPKDNSDETGKVVFSVTVDDQGDVVGIRVIETNVSPSVVNFYKNYLQTKLGNYLVAEGNPPPKSTGTITINIQSGN